MWCAVGCHADRDALAKIPSLLLTASQATLELPLAILTPSQFVLHGPVCIIYRS